MVDTVPPEVRSRIMSAVKSRDTSSEIAARRILHKLGFRFRVNVKKLPGKPDLVFAKWRRGVVRKWMFLASSQRLSKSDSSDFQ